MKTSIKAALITGILGVIGALTAAFIGVNTGEKNAVQKLYNQITTVNGNNNTVTVNNVDDFITQYNSLLSENETLKAQNSQYFADYTEQKKANSDLESQLENNPVVSYKNMKLCVECEDIPINKQNAMVTIDGRDYFSKEIVEKLIPDEENITIKDDTILIGDVVTEKANLFDCRVMDQNAMFMADAITDSFGNNYSHALYACTTYTGGYNITYYLNCKYSLLRFKISVRENAEMWSSGILTIKADDNVVYTSKTLNRMTEPFVETNIPINNCKFLYIEYSSSFYVDCIISDAIVYN